MTPDTAEQIEFLNLSIADDEMPIRNPWRMLLTRHSVSTYRDLLAKSYFDLYVTPGIGYESLAALLDRATTYGLYAGKIPRTDTAAKEFSRTNRGRRMPLRGRE